MEAVARAIAEPRRRAILRLVRDRELSAGEIASHFDVTRPAVSQHLTVLREAGLLDERREDTGRRRRVYTLSDSGLQALDRWRDDPATDLYELRDPGLLKLFCGADPARLAEAQLEQHENRLELYESLYEHGTMTDGMRLALEGGIGHEREYLSFWERLRAGAEPGSVDQSSNSPA